MNLNNDHNLTTTTQTQMTMTQQDQDQYLAAFRQEARDRFAAFQATSGRGYTVDVTVVDDNMQTRTQRMPGSIYGMLMNAIARDLRMNPPINLQQRINPIPVHQMLARDLIAVPADIIRSATYDFLSFHNDLQHAWGNIRFALPLLSDIPAAWRVQMTQGDLNLIPVHMRDVQIGAIANPYNQALPFTIAPQQLHHHQHQHQQPQQQDQTANDNDDQQHDDRIDSTRRAGGRLRRITQRISSALAPSSRRRGNDDDDHDDDSALTPRALRAARRRSNAEASTTPTTARPSTAVANTPRTASPAGDDNDLPTRQRTPLPTRRNTISGTISNIFRSGSRNRQQMTRTGSQSNRNRTSWGGSGLRSPTPEPIQPAFMPADRDRTVEDMITDMALNSAGLQPNSDWAQLPASAANFNPHGNPTSPTPLFGEMDDDNDGIDHGLPSGTIPIISRDGDYLDLLRRNQRRTYSFGPVDLSQDDHIDFTQDGSPSPAPQAPQAPQAPPANINSRNRNATQPPPPATAPRDSGRTQRSRRNSQQPATARTPMPAAPAPAPARAPAAPATPAPQPRRTRSGREVRTPRRSPTSILERNRSRSGPSTEQAGQAPATAPAAQPPTAAPARARGRSILIRGPPASVAASTPQSLPATTPGQASSSAPVNNRVANVLHNQPTVTMASTPQEIAFFRSNWRPGHHVPDQIPNHAFECPLSGCFSMTSNKRGMRRHLHEYHNLTSATDLDMNQSLPIPARRAGRFSYIRLDAQGNDILIPGNRNRNRDDHDDSDGDDDAQA